MRPTFGPLLVLISLCAALLVPFDRFGTDEAIARASLCCSGSTGNVDCDPMEQTDIGDLQVLIDYLFFAQGTLCCPQEANVDGDLQGSVDIGDISALIDYLFFSLSVPGPCLGELPVPGVLVISEIMVNPNGVPDSAGEWFEVYNPTATTYDLNGCVVTDSAGNSFTINSLLYLPAHGFLTFAPSHATGVNPNYVYTPGSFQLDDSGPDRIIILYGAMLLDSVTYESGQGGWPLLTPGQTLSLKTGAFNTTDNDLAGNWCYSVPPAYDGTNFGTPHAMSGDCMAVPAAGDLIFTEIMANPAAISDFDGEWFEIYNTRNYTVDLNDCVLFSINGPEFMNIDTSIEIPPLSFYTFATGATPGFTPNFVYDFRDFSLNNSGTDGISLYYTNILVDSVLYQAGANGWPALTAGQSYNLNPAAFNAISNDLGNNWCNTTSPIYNTPDAGTPGAANVTCP